MCATQKNHNIFQAKMSENQTDLQNPFDDARRSILHVKCSVLKKYYNQMKVETDKNRPPQVGRFRRVMDSEHLGMIGKLWWILLAYWLFDMFLSMIRFRCSQYGGTKCRFPFDLLPEWLVSSELVLH